MKSSKKSPKLQRLAILTGGGDCPGLNAAIRAVTRASLHEDVEVFGIEEGFLGLYENRIHKIDLKEVSGILPRGGTFLRSSRFNPFKDEKILKQCLKNFNKNAFDGLIAIGGDGSLGIALDLWRKHKMPINAIPKTIDNDVFGTDRTIGFHTAVQTAVDAIDKLHTTAESHNFIMVVELMGRHCGYIAAHAGIAGGADFILIPEVKVTLDKIVNSIKERHARGKNFSIVVVAEDAKVFDQKGKVIADTPTLKDEYGKIKLGGMGKLVADLLSDKLGFEARYTNLGYVQRGGSPVAFDRILATSMGCAAVELAIEGRWGNLVAFDGGNVVAKDLGVVREGKKQLPLSYYQMAEMFFG
jgi:6-phosphofructokinase 1